MWSEKRGVLQDEYKYICYKEKYDLIIIIVSNADTLRKGSAKAPLSEHFPKRDMAVSIASSGLTRFSVTEISLKPTPYYDLWDYVGSQGLQQLQELKTPCTRMALKAYTKFQASYV